MSASQLVGCGFDPGPVIPKTLKNGTHCLLVWRSTYENGVEKLNLRSYQWASPPAVAFTAFADAWPGAIEKEINAALCATGAGKDFFSASQGKIKVDRITNIESMVQKFI